MRRPDDMQDLWGTAERLREVQAAHKQFVTLWAIDQANRLLEQQFEASRKLVLGGDEADETPASADVAVLDWRGLYRGSVLDD